MGSVANNGKDWWDSGIGDSVTDSREGRCSTSSDDSRSTSDYSSSLQFLKNDVSANEGESKLKKQGSEKELEMMKERFAKLLLGEDMSGSGKGVCPALTISNAITNLWATVFGQLWRLEPLPSAKKEMWQREMEWLLSVSDHIIELTPSWQTLPNGTKREVMTCQPRSDIVIHLPALRKLDNMLIEILDGFTDTEFWYVDQGIVATEVAESVSFQKATQRQDKWWLPVPRVPPEGLHDDMRKRLQHKRECTNQILKAAMAINSIALAEMEVPDSYLETLPKNGRACLGDVIHRYINSDHFSSECLLDCLDLSSEHAALEMANRVESAINVWRGRHRHRYSWEIVKDLVIHGEKRESLAERAETLLLSLKQRFPGLTQTTLDTTKLQYNKDVGQSILESYSRVLESLAFNIVARIEDIIYVDNITKQTDKLSCSSVPHKRVVPVYSMSVTGSPYRATYGSPRFPPALLACPGRGNRTPSLNVHNNKHANRGTGVKRVLSNYLGGDAKMKIGENMADGGHLHSM